MFKCLISNVKKTNNKNILNKIVENFKDVWLYTMMYYNMHYTNNKKYYEIETHRAYIHESNITKKSTHDHQTKDGCNHLLGCS